MWIFLQCFHFWCSAEKNHFQMVLMNCVKIFFWYFKKILFRWWSDQLEKWQAFLNYSLSVTTVCQNNGADDDVWWWRSGYCLLYFPMSSLNGECVDFFIWWWVCWFFSPRNERVNFSQCSEGAKFVLPLPICSCTEEPDPWCSYLPVSVGMLLGREWKWSVATFAAP